MEDQSKQLRLHSCWLSAAERAPLDVQKGLLAGFPATATAILAATIILGVLYCSKANSGLANAGA